MAGRICTRCGGARTPIPGWPPEVTAHPMCLNTPAWVWTPEQMTAWLAEREPKNATVPLQSAG